MGAARAALMSNKDAIGDNDQRGRASEAGGGEGWSFIRAGHPPLSLTHHLPVSSIPCSCASWSSIATTTHFISFNPAAALRYFLFLGVLWFSLVRRWNSQA